MDATQDSSELAGPIFTPIYAVAIPVEKTRAAAARNHLRKSVISFFSDVNLR